MKKILSVTLALTLLLGAVCIFPTSAEHTTNGGVFRYTPLDDKTAAIRSIGVDSKEVIIPETIDGYTITEIAKRAFYKNTNIEKVTLPDTIRVINDGAFLEAVNLKEINFPENLEIIGNAAFDHCIKLKSIILPENLTYIGNSAFNTCIALTYNGLPKSLQYIGNYAFRDCRKLTNAYVPEGTTYLGDSAFMWCSEINEITLPESLVYIGSTPFFKTAYYNNPDKWEDNAFYIGPYLLETDKDTDGNFKVKDGTRTIACSAFSHTNFSSIYIPDSVEFIGEYCFSNSDYLKDVRFSPNIKEIPAYAFYYCSNIKSIDIPEGVEIIRKNAFLEARNLSRITIPKSVNTMEEFCVGYIINWSVSNNSTYEDGTTPIEDLIISGYEGSVSENYAKENYFKFHNRCTDYKGAVLELLNIPEEDPGNGGGWLEYYSEIYRYHSESTPCEATPDYVLVEVFENVSGYSFEAELFGNYILRSSERHYPSTFGYVIYLPETNEIYTLEKAYEYQIEGIEKVFTEGIVGDLLGDVNYDKKLNIKDATLIQKSIASLTEIKNNDISGWDSADPENRPAYIADFNCDGKVNIRDATAIQKAIAGIKNK